MRQRQAHPVNPYVSKAGLWPRSEQRQLGLLFTVFACDDTTRLHEVLQIEDREIHFMGLSRHVSIINLLLVILLSFSIIIYYYCYYSLYFYINFIMISGPTGYLVFNRIIWVHELQIQ